MYVPLKLSSLCTDVSKASLTNSPLASHGSISDLRTYTLLLLEPDAAALSAFPEVRATIDDQELGRSEGGLTGCREAVEVLTRVPKKISYDVNKDGVKVAVLTFMKSAWRLGETVLGVVELNDRGGRARILKASAIFLHIHLAGMVTNHEPRFHIALGHARSARIPSIRDRRASGRAASLVHAPRARRAPRVLHAANTPHDICARHTLRCRTRIPALSGRRTIRGRSGVESASLPPRGGGCARRAGPRYDARGPPRAVGQHLGANGQHRAARAAAEVRWISSRSRFPVHGKSSPGDVAADALMGVVPCVDVLERV
jgi:Rgp1